MDMNHTKTFLNLCTQHITRRPASVLINKRNWKIKAKTGYESFLGVIDQGKKNILKILFTDGSEIKVTENHTFFTIDSDEISASDLSMGVKLISSNTRKDKTVKKVIRLDEEATVYDILESESNTYYSNSVLSHNCFFLSEDQTLIDSFVINQIESEMDKEYADNKGECPIAFEIGDVKFFKKINKSLAYLVGVDVASGNGNDFSVITIVEFPTMEQVAEFRSNKLSEKFLYSKLKNILLFLQQNALEVYFSVENNGLGASILALYEFDENPPQKAYLMSDENSGRLGIAMSETTKRRSAMKFKNMIENRTYKIRSRQLLHEAKSYTRQGATFKAEVGATDDCIASNLVIIRILEEMAEFNSYAYEKIYNTTGYDDKQEEFDSEFVDNPQTLDDMPMPISIG